MKRAWKGAVSTVLAAALLAGCGGNGGGNADSSNTGSADAGSGKPRSVTLRLFVEGPRFKEYFDKYIEQFKAKQLAEKNIEVNVQLEMPPTENAAQILKTRLASNDAPDVFSLHAINNISQYNKAGYLMDLSDQPFVDKLLDSVKPAVTNEEGKVVAVPLETLSWGYLYNKKIFSEQGITPPTTLTEMKAAVDKLKAANITPFLLSYKDASIPQLFLPLTVGALVNTEDNKKDFIERMNKNEGSFSEMKSMFEVIDLVNKNGTDKALEVGADDGAAAFAQGKAAMWVEGPWYAESILKSNPDMEFGVAPLPINDNPEATMINLSVSTSLAVYSGSKNKEVAIDFVNYILDDKDSNAFFESLKFNPVATVHTFESYPWIKEASEYVKQGKAYQDPRIPQSVKDEVGKALQSYFAGLMTQDEVMKALDKTWQSSNKVNK
ncbi:ABC transporter substrate-binding protein [Paenibacillus ginsengihumi]|uniref:ABC transporter substrate-binding protein n=1 Tax=Paenibacillus ginsengihumi TaxID=431596 RepID=UPI00037ACB5F|nr:extracellular solute-binding protein [Paenibacillus ginsengihumi]